MSYTKKCKRKLVIMEKEVTKDKKRQIEQDKLETDDHYWFSRLKCQVMEKMTTLTFYRHIKPHKEHEKFTSRGLNKDRLQPYLSEIEQCEGGLASFRKRCQHFFPDLYKPSVSKPIIIRITNEAMQNLKLYYLTRNPTFYMTGTVGAMGKTWVLEFKLNIGELWWLHSFQASFTKIHFTISTHRQDRVKSLIGTSFTFIKNEDMDWSLQDNATSRILKQDTQVKGIDWTLYWSRLYSHGHLIDENISTKQSDYFAQLKKQAKSDQLCKKQTLPFCSFPYGMTFTILSSSTFTIDKLYCPLDEEGCPITPQALNLFEYTGKQTEWWNKRVDHLYKLNYKHDRLVSNYQTIYSYHTRDTIKEYLEYLQFFQWFISDSRVWKAAQQQKEVFSLLFLEFLIDV